jgi:hypothetical protein
LTLGPTTDVDLNRVSLISGTIKGEGPSLSKISSSLFSSVSDTSLIAVFSSPSLCVARTAEPAILNFFIDVISDLNLR